MKQLSRRDIQVYELNLLLEVKDFCEQHNIRFYLAGGTLLGAIRHKGFIPWDDDIDICMPRPDYDRFVKSFPASERYDIISDYLGNWDAPYASIRDLKTSIESSYGDSSYGLWIDVLPVDGLPEDMDEVQKIYKKCNFYRRLLTISWAKLGEGKTTLHKYIKYLLKPIVLFYGKKNLAAKIEKIASKNLYDDSSYVGIVTWGLYGTGERMIKSEFEKKVEVEFEGHKMPAFSCWDSYLHGLYGDYMKLPPVEDRRTHDMVVYVKEE